MCNHREEDGRATQADDEQYQPGQECPECGYTLGTDGYWYIDADQAPDWRQKTWPTWGKAR